MVVPVPSVIESPNATMTSVLSATNMSTSSRKYQDAVENGNAASAMSSPLEPAPGAVRYDVVSPFACQVIGPLSPAIWKLMLSLRPLRSGSAADLTKSSVTASLTTLWPGATVTDFWPPNRTP